MSAHRHAAAPLFALVATCVAGVALFAPASWAQGGTAAHASSADAAALGREAQAAADRAAERAAWARLQQARELVSSVHKARRLLLAPRWAADDVDQALAAAGQAERDAAEALQRAGACLGTLATPAQALDAASDDVQRALEAASAAADGVARASSGGLRQALQAAELAVARQRAAEVAVQGQADALQGLARDCADRLRRAEDAVDQVLRRQTRAHAAAQALAASWTQHHEGLAAAAALPASPGPALAPLALPPAPDGAAARRLAEALAPPAARAPAAGPAPLQRLGALAAARAVDLATLALQADAVALLEQLVQTPARKCPPSGCPKLAASLADLQSRQARTRAALAAAPAAQADLLASLAALLPPLQTRRAAAVVTLDAAQTLAAAAGAEAREASRRADEALQPRVEAAAQAEDLATRVWREALRRSGHSPSGAVAAPAYAPAPAPAPMAAPRPDIRSHARALFSVWDKEPEGFGAYTYVLINGNPSQLGDDVRRRYLRVLHTLAQRTAQAGDVDAAERPQVNVFCIPSSAPQTAEPHAVLQGYDEVLGWALLRRAQTGVLGKALAGQLASSPGPFLVTLPARIQLSGPSTPVLVADLARHDEADIADLVLRYMDGLVDDFPQRQAQWKPSLPLTVAMTMVRWASAPGRIVSSLIPPASARPPR